VISAIGRMGQIGAMLEVTVRALVNRRRTLLMLLLASAPILIALLIRLAGRPSDPERLAGNILDGLVLRTVLPLIALVFGTAALGSELEDGTATFLFTKPVRRWKIVLAKWFGAAALTSALVVPAAVIAGLLISGDQGGGLGLTLAAAVACLVAIVAYTAIFVALSSVTSRALVVGLVYVLIWEGVLAGLFEGTRIFSIRQYAMSVWDELDPTGRINAPLDVLPALLLATVVVVLAFGIATMQLTRYQVRAPE
jgi:ABC-2 type transport system permease protein